MPNGSKLFILLSTPFLRTAATLRLTRCARQPLAAYSFPAASSGKFLPFWYHSKLGFSIRSVDQFHTQAVEKEGYGDAVTSSSGSKDPHPWVEWSKLADLLLARGCSDRHVTTDEDDDSFVEDLELSDEFLKAADAFLGFARDRPDILRLLSKKNVESVVVNGSPFLFKNGEKSASRMKLFLSGDGSNEQGPEKVQTIDIMRYLLSYGHSPFSSSGGNNFKANEPLESSVRKLLVELFNLSGTVWKPKPVDSSQTDPHRGYQQSSMLPGQAMEMKMGDWFCPKCNAVNFVRNMFCFECREARPTRQLTTAEWKCPQCGFFNYGRNVSCVRCDSKRPGDTSQNPSHTTDLGMNITSSSEQIPGRLDTTHSRGDNTECRETPSHSGDRTQKDSILNDEIALQGSTNSTQPPRDSFNTHDGYTANSMRKSHYSWNNSSAYNGTPTLNSCQPPSNSFNNYDVPYSGNDNSSTPSPISSSNNWSSYGRSTPNSPQPSSSANNYNKSYGGPASNLTQTSSNLGRNNDPYVAYRNARNNDTQPAYNSYSNNNSSYNLSPASSSLPPGQSWNSDNSQNGGGTGNSWSNGSSSRPPYNSWNNYNTSNDGYTANSINRNTSYESSDNQNNSSQPPNMNYYSDSYDRSGGIYTQPSSSSMNGNSSVLPQIKSLEGSCVKEPDPLDMSEEAKAERWFRRVAQIKDISELSQIPDEDFPQIMPMRKGVNRFVVSKRKTPLERRLASQQYKRNLPIVSSDPEKDNNN